MSRYSAFSLLLILAVAVPLVAIAGRADRPPNAQPTTFGRACSCLIGYLLTAEACHKIEPPVIACLNGEGREAGRARHRLVQELVGAREEVLIGEHGCLSDGALSRRNTNSSMMPLRTAHARRRSAGMHSLA